MKRNVGKHSGMTLVEGMVGMMLIAIFALILFTGLLSSKRVMSRGDEIERQGQQNAADIAAGGTGGTQPGQVRVIINGIEIVFYGNYSGKTDPDNPAADLTEFIVTPTPQTAS